MERSSEFVSQITNFPILSPEESESGVSLLLSKFFKFGRSSTPENVSAETPAPEEAVKEEKTSIDETTREGSITTDAGTSSSQYSDDFMEGRSLQKVLKRISSLVALRSSSGTRYADTEQARYWMPDNVSKECYDCGIRFSAFRRRHHCRVCGQIFCARCCSHRVPGHVCGCAGGLRVCTYCCKIVLGYLQSVDSGMPLSPDLRALQENLKEKSTKENSQGSDQGFLLGNNMEFSKDTIMGDPNDLSFTRQISIQDTYRHLCLSLPLQLQRYRLIRYPGVWRGGDILQWLLDHANIQTRLQANDLCQTLLREGLIECVTEHQNFTDYGLYRPINPPILASHDPDEPSLMGSTSSYCLNLNVAENSAHLVRGQRSDNNQEELINDEENKVPLESDGDVKVQCEGVEAAGQEHLRLLLVQGLTRAGLALTWTPILLPLCRQAANLITPDTNSIEWDIRKCVRVKRVPGGTMRESCVVGGIVFSKNVAHKGMPTSLSSPRILLLRCSLVYQRVEGKLISLEPVILQEQEYLRNCCARILALSPDVVIVQGSVSRIAQDELLNHGKVLVIGVRESTLQRLARCTQADILTSIDARVGAPRLGTCKAFYLKNFENKTLMVIEGYDKDLKGCSLILRGAPLEELARIKNMIGLIILAAYNWRLETSLFKDMSATIPMSSTSLMFIDNSKDNSPEKNVEDEINGCYTDFLDYGIIESSEVEAEKNPTIQKTIESKLSIAVTDPLTSDSFSKAVNNQKKIETEKGPTLSFGITVNDFSDPLRSRRISVDDEVFLPQKVEPENCVIDIQPDILRNRWSADESVLSMSPHVRVCAPFLESEAGRQCSLRHYYCTPLFHSPHVVAPPTPRTNCKYKNVKSQPNDIYSKEAHAFVTCALTRTVEDTNVRTLLANFRALGGRLPNGPILKTIKKTDYIKNCDNNDDESCKTKKYKQTDPLDPEQHQRIYLLFYSFSHRSSNAPDFCINPSIIHMEMYGLNDISLGQFLERHCFAQQFSCPSPSCQAPLMHHVRKFVHGDGCITVTCVSVDNSSTVGSQSKLLVDDEGKQSIMWWCRCLACGERSGSGGSCCLRPVSLAISLAKYLEIRFHAPRYTRSRSCHHSLHQHYAHYFACGNVTACFKYNKINSWNICLPPSSITTHYNTRNMRDFLLNQVNDFVLKGHELFSHFGDGDHEKEMNNFKQHVEQIQLNLTSSMLLEQTSGAGVVRWLWSVSDALVTGEKLLQDYLEKWTTHTNNRSSKSIQDNFSVDVKIESDNISQNDVSTADAASEKLLSSTSNEMENQGEEEEDKADRRGLRAIITQLLSNSQPANQNGVVLCGGVVPVVVMAGEISSVVAAALASLQYHQQLYTLSQTKGFCFESEEKDSPNNKEKGDNDSKSKRNFEHIDVQLRDGLFCRIYYPFHFLKLRSLLLCPLKSNTKIVNTFELRQTQSNLTKTKDDVPNGNLDPQKETEADQGVTVERENSVEASPILNIRKSSEEKLKKIGKDSHGKLNNNLESFNEIEEGFIRSLTRCVPWAARGGKSGSTFCKTTDDRYILKEMSKLELQLFVDLAPHYFVYIQQCLQNNYPTLLGRIVGVYRVGGVEGVGGGVLVMENLWHGRTDLTRRFDLKGAQRNRLAEQGPPDVVLLDENLLNLRWESPIYLQSHCARVLWAAVERDTSFLATHHVMDYSLLVGLDEEDNELVLGIIDYIRTFTWDKKLEHIVKKGLGSGLPTIVSPEQYKLRFCNAMRKYFLQSPNQWEDLDKGLLCNNI